MNKFINSLEKSLPFVFGLCVFLYFGLVYPHHVHYQEQFQLFLTTPAFFLEMAAKPGGISNYLGTFLTQFFLFSWMGAAIIALLLAAMQWLIQTIANKISPARAWLALSFIPSVFYWILLCNENFLTGGVVSILVALGAWLLYFHINKTTTRNLYVVLAIPVIYWIAGGSAIFFTLGCLTMEWFRNRSARGRITASVLFILMLGLCLFTAKVIQPQYPFARLIYGTDYFRYPKSYPSGIWVMWLFCLLIPLSRLVLPAVFKKPQNQTLTRIIASLVIVCTGAYMITINTDTAKEDIMAYDHYVRMQQWDKAIARADHKTPSSPLSVACLNLSLCKSGMMSDNMFRYYQNGPEGLIPTFARDFTIPMVTGEVYYHLGFINTAQRFAFEAMESLPNYWKSGRALKRLAETNMINGQYQVALKYLNILKNTLFYKAWANYVIPFLEDEALIDGHPDWGNLRKHRTKTDFFDSEQEKDMMLGILLQQDLTHYMAYEYLLAYCLLTKDLERFVQYFPLGMELHYARLPYSYQEALMYHWAMNHEDPFRTVPYPISEDIMRNMSTYQNLFLNSSDPEEVLKKNYSGTYWYYLHFR